MGAYYLAMASASGRGAGALEYGILIEGSAIEFVTQLPNPVPAPPGGPGFAIVPPRMVALVRESCGWSFSVVPYDAKMEASGADFELIEPPFDPLLANRNPLTELFTAGGEDRADVNRSQLAVTLDPSMTTVTVVSTTGFSAGPGVIYVGTEAVRYTAKTATTFTGCTRGYYESQAYRHVVDPEQSVFPEVTDWPISWKGRRIQLRAYGNGETEPTVVWRGRIAREPRCSGVKWTIACEHISKMLDQEIGAEFEPIPIRGFYFPVDAPLEVKVGESDGPSEVWPIARDTIVVVTGHHETIEAVIEALDAALAAAAWVNRSDGSATTPTCEWGAHLTPDGSAAISALEPSGGPVGVHLIYALWAAPDLAGGGLLGGGSIDAGRVDAMFARGDSAEFRGGRDADRGFPPNTQIDSASGVYVAITRTDRVINTTYGWVLNPIPLARTTLNLSSGLTDPSGTAAVGDRIYFLRAHALPAVGARLLVNTATDSGLDGGVAVLIVVAVDAPGNFVRVRKAVATGLGGIGLGRERLYGWRVIIDDGSDTLSIRPFFDSASEFGDPDAGWTTPRAFIDALAGLSAANAGDERYPWIVGSEFEFVGADGTSMTEIEAFVSTMRKRKRYVIVGPTNIGEVLAESLKMMGVFWRVNVAGQLTFARVGAVARSDPRLRVIDESTTFDGESAESEPGEQGVVPSVLIRQGWDPWEQKWKKPHRLYRDQESIDRYHPPQSSSLEIADIGQRWYTREEETATFDEVAAQLRIYGRARPYVTVQVTIKAADLLLGDPVLISQSMLPDYTRGVRGFQALSGRVVSLDWSNHHQGRGTIIVHISQEVRGYAPSARLSNPATLIAGLTYDCPLEGFRFTPSTKSDGAFWEAGDLIEVRQWDVATAVTAKATVVSYDTSSLILRITFTVGAPAGWLVAANTWEIAADDWDPADASQEAYSYVADELAELGSTPDRAQRWGP